jgi:hypothetical protein
LARAGFIFYLVIIHLWSFVILFFHAHSFQENADFGVGIGGSHGPHALMMQQHPLTASFASNGDASGVLLTPNGGVTQELESIEVKRGDRSMQTNGAEGHGHVVVEVGPEEKEVAIADGEGDRDVGKEGPR